MKNSAPRLRTQLTAILVVMLGIACLIFGISSYVILQKSLMNQVTQRLDEASHRATIYKPEDHSNIKDLPMQEESVQSCDQSGKSPLDAPGQGSGTLSVCIENGQVVSAGVLDTNGQSQELSENDIQEIQQISVDDQAVELGLETGDYLLEAQQTSGDNTVVMVVGIPLKDTHRTLAVLATVMGAGSLIVMLVAGLLGSWIIRRTMKPLERVSAVAHGVAHSNLETETISQTSRVSERDSNPGSEVGAVGFALNQLLDNVQSALESRQRTEDQMRVFIADASHELRTPLAAIKGYSDLIRWTEDLSDAGEESVQRIESQTQRMSRLVEDLLLLARLDEGRKPQFTAVDLTELLIENVSDLQVAAPDHRWKLDLPDEPVEVTGDPAQLQQVLLNLLSNARKHTDEGTEVTAGLALLADQQEAVMTVADNGPGIAPEFLDKIFDRFTRADKARSGSDGTTGLGLPIVKAIVESHGGTIEVTSKPGHTLFSVRLPINQK